MPRESLSGTFRIIGDVLEHLGMESDGEEIPLEHEDDDILITFSECVDREINVINMNDNLNNMSADIDSLESICSKGSMVSSCSTMSMADSCLNTTLNESPPNAMSISVNCTPVEKTKAKSRLRKRSLISSKMFKNLKKD